MLSAELQSEILALHFGQGKGTRAIAQALRVNRKSVRRVVEGRQVKLTRESGSRASILDAYKPRIELMMEKDPSVTAARILQSLRREGYLGGYSILKTWVKQKREIPHRKREAYLRLEFPAGETAQVDWGEFGAPFGDGVKIHCFLMVLCFSRLLYIEFTRSEKFEDFIRCHENAFRFFGENVPQEIWYDNLATAVTERMAKLVRFNSRFMAYLGHHGVRPHACNPARGNEKGRVEDGVKFVRSSFWAGRTFTDFPDLNHQARQWLTEFANRREHRSTRKVPELHFEAEEKKLLRPMNPHPYEDAEVVSRVVPPQFMIVHETNRYSVPWTLVGMTLTLKIRGNEIAFFYHDRLVARHVRSYLRNQIIEDPAHQVGLLDRKPGVTRESWQVQAIKNLGPAFEEYLKLLRAGSRSIRHEVSRILALATVYGDQATHEACRELLSGGMVGSENLELILKTRFPAQTSQLNPEPIQFQNQRLNRVIPTVDLRRYDALLFASTPTGHSPVPTAEIKQPVSSERMKHENDHEPHL
jgi:transposase